MRRLLDSRFGLFYLHVLVGLCLFAALRLVLLCTNLDKLDLGFLDIPRIFGIGSVMDMAFLAYSGIPLLLYLTLLPEQRYHQHWNRRALGVFTFLFFGLLYFDLGAEWLFWDEFASRFNFISVDYLIYRREVTGNISESYPLKPIFTAIGFAAFFTTWFIRDKLDYVFGASSNRGERFIKGAALLSIPLAIFYTVDSGDFGNFSENHYEKELAKNGPYEFFHAYTHNELDYTHFYLNGDSKKLSPLLQNLVKQEGQTFTEQKPFSIARRIETPSPEKHLNVMMVVVESLSGEYLQAFGDKQNLTPYLNQLADESLFFTNFYATGTRTVRGMEAISLAIPPTPGQSVVRRPNNENLFSLGWLLRDKGYDSKFIYGGYGYFDNMNAYFGSNGFEVVDRTNFADDEKAFGNVWGVADEFLFMRAIREADKSFAQKKPFYSFVMTTSNHRPYTYPSGRIDIPSGSGREGAVKYTDYAIRKLIEDSRSKPWFKDTLFVIVADHCAGSAGKSELPVDKYHIPLLVYAPGLLAPRKVDTLSSQIDLAPTLLSLMNMRYTSRFFGKDILTMKPEEGRALMGTYQKLGYFRNNTLVILSPQQKVDVVQDPMGKAIKLPVSQADTLVNEALAYYQGASQQLKQGLFRHVPGENSSKH